METDSTAPAVIKTAPEDIRPEDAADDIPKPKSNALLTPSLLSHSSSVSQASPYEYQKIAGWLRLVDDNLDKRTSNQLLFLGAKSEIGEGIVENCKRPSEFYILLSQRSDSDEQALARFMYALQGLGKWGKYCNREFHKKAKTAPPSLEEYEQRAKSDREFGFYQCLVEMCVSLGEERDVSKRLKKYICRHIIVSRARNEGTIASVFLRMLRYPDVLSVTNQDQLALALDQVGAIRCWYILRQFRSQFNMPEIELESLTPCTREDNISLPPSTNPSSTNGSIFGSEQSSLRSNSPRRYSPRNLLVVEPPELVRDRLRQMQQQQEEPLTEETPLVDGEPNARQMPPPREESVGSELSLPPPGRRFGSWRRLLVAFFTLGLVLTAGAGLSMIVLASIESSSIPPLTTVYDNTTVALGNVQKFTTQSVNLYQDPGNDEVYIPLTFYLADKSCDELSTKTSKTDSATNKSVPLQQSQVIVFRGYLMPGSELNYSFCAVTDQLNGTQYHIDLYVAESFDESYSFDPKHSPYSLHRDIGLVYSSDLQPNNNCLKTITYAIKRRGPYSIVIFLPLQTEVPFSNIRLWYTRRDELKIIDTSRLMQTCANSPANRSEPCRISVGSHQHFIKVLCVVVRVGDSHYDQFTSVRVSLDDSDVEKIWFWVVGGFVVALFSCVFILLVVLVCWCRRS